MLLLAFQGGEKEQGSQGTPAAICGLGILALWLKRLVYVHSSTYYGSVGQGLGIRDQGTH